MWMGVVPAYNEAESIAHVINTLLSANIDQIILVANGCTDNTCEAAACTAAPHLLQIISFPEPIGIDMPRAIGAAYAKQFQPSGIVFIDGDMKGELTDTVLKLVDGIRQGLDMALTNCYPYVTLRSDLAALVLRERSILNQRLGLSKILGLASPSHGPHAVSARFLECVPLKALAIPPLSLAIAALNNLRIDVAAAIAHDLLCSDARDSDHADLIAHTIIEDCRQALKYLDGEPLNKVLGLPPEPGGYRIQRRFDLLAAL